jgi:hypothetical protein
VVAHTETQLVSDHPVCAASVASRHFITGAATSPQEASRGGDHVVRKRMPCKNM